jgi:hypothetical protein
MRRIMGLCKKTALGIASAAISFSMMAGMGVSAYAHEGNLLGQSEVTTIGQAEVTPVEHAEQIEETEAEENAEAVTKKAVKNNKIDFGTWKQTSTMDGYYYAEGVPGIAMTDPEFRLRAEANMSYIEYFFVTTWDITQDTAPLAVNTFRIVAASENALLGPVVQININKVVNRHHYSLEGNPVQVTTMIGIPEDFRMSGAKFGVVCVKSGGVYEILPDLDTYDSTVTFKAKAGDAAYALIRY